MKLLQIYAPYPWKERQRVDTFKYCPLCGTPFVERKIAQKIRPLCPRCGFVYYQNPSPTVSVLVIQDHKVLLGKRLGEPGKGKWALPSGYIEFDDDFLSTAIREVREETGLDIDIVSILNVQSAFLPPESHFLTVFLRGQVTGGTLKPQDDLEDAKWFALSGPLPEMAFQPDVDLIEAYARGEIEGITVHQD